MTYLAEISRRTSFGVEIEFGRNLENPSRILLSLAKIIQACEDLDRKLIQTIQVNIEPTILLEDIEKGSIKTLLGLVFRKLKNTPEIEYDEDKVAEFLVESKYAIVNFGESNIEFNNETIAELQMRIHEIANETNPTPKMPVYTNISKQNILGALGSFQNALEPLQEEDEASLVITDGRRASFRFSADFSPGSIEDMLFKEELKNSSRRILKIKKPDYLGSSKWEFKDEKNIEVKLEDFEWLKRFHQREIPLAPGDSLRVDLETTTRYDIDYNVMHTGYIITKVIEVIKAQLPETLNLNIRKEDEG